MERVGMMICGRQATGKTTMEMNLRQAVCGSWLTDEKYQVAHGVCFMGKTARRLNAGLKPLAIPGADSTESGFDDLPEAKYYVAHTTSCFSTVGGEAILRLMNTMHWVHSFGLTSTHRDDNLAKRRKAFRSRFAPKPLKGDTLEDFAWPRVTPKIAHTLEGPHRTSDVFDGYPTGFMGAYERALVLLGFMPQNAPAFDVDIVNKEIEAWAR